MRLLNVHVTNFGSYVDETLDFTSLPNIIAVIGQNGHGKSTLFVDAPSFALFNRARAMTAAGSGVENIIHHGKDFTAVELAFEMNGHNYKVVRRRSPNSHELELWIDGIDNSEKITETQAKINSIIKMDYETLLDTVCIGQGRSSSFMDKKPDQRKDVFGEVLGLGKYELLEAAAKEKRKAAKDEIELIKRRLSELSDDIEQRSMYEKDVNDGTQRLQQLKDEITTLEILIEKELTARANYDSILKASQEIIERRREAKEKLEAVTGKLMKGKEILITLQSKLGDKTAMERSINEQNKKIEESQDTLQELSSKKSSLEAKVVMLTKQARDLKEKHSRLKDHNEAECEFCGQNITEASKEESLGRFKNEARSYILEMKQYKEEIDNYEELIKGTRTQIKICRETIDNVSEELRSHQDAENKIARIESDLKGLEEQQTYWGNEFAFAMSKPVAEVNKQSFKDVEYRNEVEELRQQQSDWQGRVAVAKRELERLASNKRELTELEEKFARLEAEYAEWDDLVHAYGKSGIQALIIENNLGDIQDEINDVLGTLTDNKVEIEFRTQKAKKGKSKDTGAIETLDILIKDESGTRVYETYSGGERFRVDFACHVGLSQFLARRAGAAIRFFVIDEGVGSQDGNAKGLLYHCMNMLSSKFDNVIVISHIEDFIEEFDYRLLVTKDSQNGSKVRLLG